MVVVFEEEVIRVTCAYAFQLEDQSARKINFMASEWDLQNPGGVVLGMRDFNGHVGRRIDSFKGGYGIGKRNVEGRRLLEFCDEKELCVANTWFEKKEQKK